MVLRGAGLGAVEWWPSTTVPRGIWRLEREGLMLRVANQEDAGSRYVSLTARGLRLTGSLLDSIGPLD